MKLIERYIFLRLLRAFFLALLTLSATVWLTQALAQVSLMTVQGQAFEVFLRISLLILPEVASVIAPVAVLIAVAYTFTALNNESELVVINASGAPQMSLLKPVLLLSLVAAALIATMTLYLGPVTQRMWRSEITAVRTSVLTSILKEGAFMKIAEGVTFNLRSRRPDGSLSGIFVSDSRDATTTATYLAAEGAVVESPLGTFLIMNNGSIQRRSKTDGSISMIEFGSYAFDLTTFTSQAQTPTYRPSEQATSYLLSPDLDDPIYRKAPGQFIVELHRRLVSPLYAPLCALLPLVFLAQAESTRRRRALALASGIGIAVVLRVTGAFLNAASDVWPFAVLSYLLPVGFCTAAVVLILTGRRPRVPDRFADITDDLAERLRALTGRPAPADRYG